MLRGLCNCPLRWDIVLFLHWLPPVWLLQGGGLSSTGDVQSFFGPSGELMEIILIIEAPSEAAAVPDHNAAGLLSAVPPAYSLPAVNTNRLWGIFIWTWVCLFCSISNNNPYTGSGVCLIFFRCYLGIFFLWFSAVTLLWKSNKTYFI